MAGSPEETDKAASAYRTIGEVSRETGLPQHILRYWETRFPQLRPLQRSGNRRYYRPDDVALVRRIADLLHQQGYTIRGVQLALATKSAAVPALVAQPPVAPEPVAQTAPPTSDLLPVLLTVRAALSAALAEDALV